MAINRAPFNALVDDDGSGTTGTIWNKSQIQYVILDPVDAAILNPTAPIVLAGGQIQFPATPNPSGSLTTLDEYREGVWTPALIGAGGSAGITYSTQFGEYIKEGRKVTFTAKLVLTSKGTASGVITIGGLPYPTNPSGAMTLVLAIVQLSTTPVIWTLAQIGAGASIIELYYTTAATTVSYSAAWTFADFANNTQVVVSGSYLANT